jgi:hypothetical protein
MVDKYDGFDKFVLDLNEMDSWPTPSNEAVVFAKNNEIIRAPENYIKDIVSRDIEERAKKELENSRSSGEGEIISNKYYENFSGFNDGKEWKNIFISSIKLNEPIKNGENEMIPVDFNYEIIVVDEFGNIVFRTFSPNLY